MMALDPREGGTRFVWVTDFPLFEKDPATGALGAVHHPFTAPHPDDIGAARPRPGEGARARLRPRAQRHRARRRQHPHRRPGDAGAHLRAARHRRRDGAAAVRVPPRGTAVGRAAARRDRVRLRPDRDGARRRDVAARGDRVPEDHGGARAVRRRAGARFRPRNCAICICASMEPAEAAAVSDDVITQRISAEGADMLTLAGVNDANLIELARLCGVKVYLRGDTLSLTGTPDAGGARGAGGDAHGRDLAAAAAPSRRTTCCALTHRRRRRRETGTATRRASGGSCCPGCAG